MAKVDITLHNMSYTVTCGPGEEARLREIVKIVDQKMNDIAKRVTSATESRLLMLTCLTLADELSEAKRLVETTASAEEDLMVKAVEHLQGRVAAISARVGHA